MSNQRIRERPGSYRTPLFLFVSLALLPFALLAQNPRGTLRGVVQDASGARVPSAKIFIRAAESALQREIAVTHAVNSASTICSPAPIA